MSHSAGVAGFAGAGFASGDAELSKRNTMALFVAAMRTEAATVFGVSRRAIGHRTKHPQVAEARMALAVTVWEVTGFAGSFVAEPLGLSVSGLTKAKPRVRDLCDIDPKFKLRVEDLKSRAARFWGRCA